MRGFLLLGLLAGLSLLTGCATLTRSADDVAAGYRRQLTYEMRMLADDTNFALLSDRPSRLTRWHLR
jgi:hypothetical protein